jgi:hypothetical protein
MDTTTNKYTHLLGNTHIIIIHTFMRWVRSVFDSLDFLRKSRVSRGNEHDISRVVHDLQKSVEQNYLRRRKVNTRCIPSLLQTYQLASYFDNGSSWYPIPSTSARPLSPRLSFTRRLAAAPPLPSVTATTQRYPTSSNSVTCAIVSSSS